jgi:uncharacterized protein YvpB
MVLYRMIVIAALLAVTVMPAAAPAAAAGSETAGARPGNLLVLSGSRDFAAGAFSATELDAAGRVVLRQAGGKPARTGSYTSPVLTVTPFTDYILSWNADTPPGTRLGIESQVLVDNSWSPWLSWGYWSTSAETGSAKQAGGVFPAAVDTDTLTVKAGKRAQALRYRLTLQSDKAGVTPAVRLVAAAVTDKGQKSRPAITGQPSAAAGEVLAVPGYSQRLRDPAIAGRICSPTSLTMVLNYYGINVIPEETAWGVMDRSGDLFGNWPFNCAYAGSFGLQAYVAYLESLDDLRREIAAGRPVIASVIYRNSETVAQKLPVLHSAPISYTDGHLVVVCGFTRRDGQEYVVVNDPAARDNASVRREYLASEFAAAWVQVAYLIAPGPDGVSQPVRIAARVKDMGKKLTLNNTGFRRVAIEADGKRLDLSPAQVRSLVLLRADGTAEYPRVDPDQTLLLAEQAGERPGKLIVIAANHRVYEAATR